MKKTKRSFAYPKSSVNYKKRKSTQTAFKAKPFKGFAGVRPSLSADAAETAENLDLGIVLTEAVDTGETDFPSNTQSNENGNDSYGLNILNEIFEPNLSVADTPDDGITITTPETNVLPTMSNTKREILAFAEGVGITVNSNWSKKKILDALQD